VQLLSDVAEAPLVIGRWLWSSSSSTRRRAGTTVPPCGTGPRWP